MSKRFQASKAGKSEPITSWGGETKIRRSAEGLWGASKFAHNPRAFIANVLRPAASAMAESYPGRSEERTKLQNYAYTNFSLHEEALEEQDKVLRTIRYVQLDLGLMRDMITNGQEPHSTSAYVINRLLESGTRYHEPNAPKPKTGRTIIEGRGDLDIIHNQVKYLAYLAMGDVALQQSTPKDSAA